MAMKAIPIDAFSEDAWQIVMGEPLSSGKLTPLAAYKRVGLMYRAVDVRAKAVSAFPYTLERAGEDVTDSEETAAIRANLRKILFLLEASLCLWGAAYALKLSDRLRWLQTKSITPQYDQDAPDGIKAFTRKIGGVEKPLKRDSVLWVFLPNLEAETGPGAPPAMAALQSAGVLDSLEMYLEGYFARGAIRATLLVVEGSPSKDEKDKLEAWWKRMLSGVKKAYETVAIRSNVKPIVIGDGLKDTTNKALTDQERENVLIPMGVPLSIVLSNAANYATAQQDALTFYDLTVIPDIRLIEEQLAPWFKSMGYTFKFRPERLEVYQDRNLKKAEGLAKIAGPAPLVTRDEARSQLGLPAWAEVAPEEPDPTDMGPPVPNAGPNPPAAQGQAQQAQAQQQAQGQGRAPAGRPAAPHAAQGQAQQTRGSPKKTLDYKALDLDRWARKAAARKAAGRPAGPFESAHIPPAEAASIRGALAWCTTAQDVDHLFGALKRLPGDGLSDAESVLYRAILQALEPYDRELAAAIVAGDSVDLSKLSDSLRAALVTTLAAAVSSSLAQLPATLGLLPMDPAQAAALAAQWADEYTAPLLQGMNQHTHAVVEKVIQAFRTTPGMTRGHVESLLAEAFGARRAELIAITESTRAASQASTFYQAYLQQNGIELIAVWSTNEDEMVCPICGALNDQPESEWIERYPDGPPAHVRCRCHKRLEMKGAKP